MRKGIRCTISFMVNQVTCPGVWLSNDGVVALSIKIFGQKFFSNEIFALFPLCFYQRFIFTKIYTNCRNFLDVCKAQLEEKITIELVQLHSKATIIRLAKYENLLANFLFPSPKLVPPYSGKPREIILCPTLKFPGIIGPRLEFSTDTALEETMDCCHCCTTPRKSFEHYERGRSGKKSTSQIDVVESGVKNENKSPFVVRKIDEKMFSRVPSFHQSKSQCSYCCTSPHRHSKCAACRFKRTESPSPIRIKRRNHSSSNIERYCEYCNHSTRHLKSDCKFCNKSENEDANNGEIQQPSSALTSPRNNPDRHSNSRLSLSTSTIGSNKSPDLIRLKSPVFDRPSYQERFGSSPINISTNVFQRPEPEEIKEPVKIESLGHGCCHHTDLDCWSHNHLDHYSYANMYSNCCRNCNNYECPLFWRYRFGPPYSFYNWRSFHHGLTRIYDDLYKDYI